MRSPGAGWVRFEAKEPDDVDKMSRFEHLMATMEEQGVGFIWDDNRLGGWMFPPENAKTVQARRNFG